MFSIWENLWNHIDIVKRDFSLVAESKVDLSLNFGVDSLVEAHYDIFSRLPLETSLPSDDVVGVDLLPSKLFNS